MPRTAAPFPTRVQRWITENEGRYAFRYLGALAGDFHRILANGGMFLYPAIVNHPNPKKNRPQGKLRLMYEGAVVAFIAARRAAWPSTRADAPSLTSNRKTITSGRPSMRAPATWCKTSPRC